MTSHPTRTRYAATSFLLDVALLLVTYATIPVAWERFGDVPLVAGTIALTTLLAVFLAGGYRLAFPLRPSLARLTPVAFAFGAGSGWLLLKLLSQKIDLWRLIPPALESFTPTVVILALLAFVHRAIHLRLLARHEDRLPVALLATDATAADLTERWQRRGWRGTAITLRSNHFTNPFTDLHALVLALPLSSLQRPELERLAEARASGLPVMTAARFEEELFGYTPLATPDDPWLLFDDALERRTVLYLGTKRLLDVLLALLAIAIAIVPFVALALAMRLTGPVFYRQTRAGLNRRPFTLWKLRTMVPDAERLSGPIFAGPNDPRVTRIGRFLRRSRIDELPQLWNILKGDMSLVGPRPERPEFDRELAPDIPYYALRHLARPGLTGWAQVRMGYGASSSDAFRKLEHDVYYLKHASLWFDLEIVVRTIPVVLRLRGR